MRKREYVARREKDGRFVVGYFTSGEPYMVECAYADTKDEADTIAADLQREENSQWSK